MRTLPDHVYGDSMTRALMCWCGPELVKATSPKLAAYYLLDEEGNPIIVTEDFEETFFCLHFDPHMVRRGHGKGGWLPNPRLLEGLS